MLRILTAADDPTPSACKPVTMLHSGAQSLRGSTVSQDNNLAAKTIQLADVATSTAVINRELLQLAVRILEQSIHGTVSRAMRAKSEHLATVSRGMELKLAIIGHEANPTNPSAVAADEGLGKATQQYAVELRQLNANASGDFSAAEAKLKDYASAGKGMSDIARRYAELEVEITEVKDEIARLEQAD